MKRTEGKEQGRKGRERENARGTERMKKGRDKHRTRSRGRREFEGNAWRNKKMRLRSEGRKDS